MRSKYPPAKVQLDSRLDAAIRSVLPRSAVLEVSGSSLAPELRVNGTALSPAWLRDGTLPQVRALLNRRPRPNLVVARRMSPGAQDALSAAGIGWLDETGAAEIAIDSLLVSRSPRANLASERRPRWTPTVLAVAEALLCGVNATVEVMVRVTGVSAGSCTYALRTLSELGLVASAARRGRGSGRRLDEPSALLDAYAFAAADEPPTPSVRVGAGWVDIVQGLVTAGRRWKLAGRPWAATGAVAASVMAPYLSAVTTAEVYVNARSVPALEAAAAEIDLRPADGGRLVLKPFPTTTARRLADEVNGLRVAPWPRIYADLRTTGVRGEEAAEHLREVVLAR
jgi:hypothetical protein